MLGVKRVLDIRLNRKASEQELRAVALELKSRDSRSYTRTFMVYYLPGMTIGGRAWATTHFNPNLEVRILGWTIEEEERIAAEPAPANREVLGRWLNESPFVASRIMIYREGGRLLIEENFKDGSSLKKELVERDSPIGRRFDPMDPSPSISSRQSVKPPSNERIPSRTSETRKFLTSKLAELDSFKSGSQFRTFGFAVGGPYNSWLKSIQSNRNPPGASFEEKVAVGDLLTLGLEYVYTKGLENEATRFSRRQITQVIQEDGEGGGSGAGDHWILGADGNLQCRDRDGLIFTAKRIE